MSDANENFPAKFHASLNVADLSRSVDFYRRLFGQAPATSKTGYAKFELAEPPLVLSLIPGNSHHGGRLNHVGIRLSNAETLFKMQTRLETEGIQTQRQEGVECCHSTQTKFWVIDPDHVLWEFYILHEDEDAHPQSVPKPQTNLSAQRPRKLIWQHQIPTPFLARIPYEENSLHEIVLEGTANMDPASLNLGHVTKEVFRVLRPGGKISLHGLAGNKAVTQSPLNLPGPAAVVQHVPVAAELTKILRDAGFVQILFEKLSATAYFVVEGAELREVLIVAQKPGHRPQATAHVAVYLGPLAQVMDDAGNVFCRGEHVALNIHDWQLLGQSSVAGQFLLLPPASVSPK